MFYSKTTGGFYDSAIHGDNIPADAVEITKEEHQALINGQSTGKRIVADADGRPMLVDPPALTFDEIKRSLTGAVQAHLDATAQARGYDGILSLASYAASTNATFAAEALAGVQWRDAVWAYCWQVLADVEASQREIPTAEVLVAELPVMVWPA